ncbi:hypothetical protein SteCoe_36771 [Stentor coeruleus]|uniref:Uncharacterized protein n=1 Tax=Stentor coeruleus TaxID=5963 RepID=A0A1R2APF5_9CILI|nr:hypothetical protein SteCoe_36771 [Stentor coeruleus]
MEGMERTASEQLAKLSVNSETEEMSVQTIQKRLKNKLKDVKDIVSSTEMSADEKASKIYQLLTVQAENTKKLEIEAGSIRKRTSNSVREKEAFISEINSYREIKVKLESYCREVKKKNDEIIQEWKSAEESEKKKLEEITEKMNNALKEINEKFEENEGEKNRLLEENKAMIKQMEDLKEQALSRDQEFQATIMEKNLESQLLKVQVEYKTGFEETQLKTQVDLYKNRFGEFQSILEKSTEAYGIADAEGKKIDDKISTEQKINSELRKIKEKYDIEIIQLYTFKQTLTASVSKLKAQHDALKLDCSKLLQAKKK